MDNVRLPEIGQIVAYSVRPGQPLDEYVSNRLFYVAPGELDEYNQPKFTLYGLSNNQTMGIRYVGVRVNLNDAENWMDLDAAIAAEPRLAKFAEQFNPQTYKPRIGDKVLVTRRHTEEENVEVVWTPSMDALIGESHEITRMENIDGRDAVKVNGWWVRAGAIRPVFVQDVKKLLREKAARNIATKIASWNSPYELRGYDRSMIHINKQAGHEVSKLRAIAEQKNASEGDVGAYLAYINDNLYWRIRDRVEPTLKKVLNKMGTEWQRVPLNFVNPFEILHCLHVSVEEPTKIAYYPNLRHLREQREVRTSLGKYLTKYKDVFALEENQIRDIAQRFAAAQATGGYTLKFAEQDQPNMWVHVYNVGPGSCMTGADEVQIYASGVSNLRLAYLEDLNGYVVARCIVRDPGPGESDSVKGYVRVYPDPCGDSIGRRLKDMLEAEGYGHHTDTDGCLLSYIETDNGVMCPYLDQGSNGSQEVDIAYGPDGKKYLRVGSGYDAATTSGYINLRGATCDCCNEAYDEDSLIYVESVDERVCDSCLESEYAYAYARHGYREYFAQSQCVYVDSLDEWYHKDWLDRHDIYICEVDDEYYHVDDLVPTSRGYVHERHCVELSVEDDVGNGWAVSDDAVQLANGDWVHEDMAENCWVSGEWLLTDDSDGTNVQVFVREMVTSSGYSHMTYRWVSLEKLAESLDDWVVEFAPQFRDGKYQQSISCLTWKGMEAAGSAVMSFRDLTYDQIRSDAVYEQIFEYLDTEGYLTPMEEAA